MDVDDKFWKLLLLCLEQRNVIPIVGRDLMTVEFEGRPVNAYRLLAERFADDLGVDRANLPANFTLSDIIAQSPELRSDHALIYGMTHSVFERLRLPVPEPLRLLARIPALRVFVSTTFDPWLDQALLEERCGGSGRSLAVAYSPEDRPDLSDAQTSSHEPVVFQLFGRVQSEPRYAVTEEDLLEYVHSLQQDPPQKLCDLLRSQHLLFIGNAFSDWLARFFVRTARGKRLIAQGMKVFIVDDALRQSGSEKSFFQGFCLNTSLLENNTPVEFVRQLHQKWFERHPATEPAEAAPATTAAAASAVSSESASHSLFISYASEDRPAAERICERLRKFGLNVWFDRQGGLREGDDYAAKIAADIGRCTLFLPVLSRNVNRSVGDGRFFRREWSYAIHRLPDFTGAERPFILPIIVDDLKFGDAANIPGEFKRIHVTRAPGGDLPDEAARRYQQIVREIVKAEGALV